MLDSQVTVINARLSLTSCNRSGLRRDRLRFLRAIPSSFTRSLIIKVGLNQQDVNGAQNEVSLRSAGATTAVKHRPFHRQSDIQTIRQASRSL